MKIEEIETELQSLIDEGREIANSLKILRTNVQNNLGKSWGKTSQKSSKNHTNVPKTVPP